MKNLTGAWINTGNSEFFVRNNDFFTNKIIKLLGDNK